MKNVGRNKIISVTGVSGVGKDFLLRKVLEDERIAERISIFNFGDELFKELKKDNPQIVGKYDIANYSQDQVKKSVSCVVGNINRHAPVMLTTQVVYRQGGGFFYNIDNETAINPEAYVYVYADPYEIRDWRIVDRRRGRKIEDILDIELHQNVGLDVVSVLGGQMGTFVLRMKNSPGKVKENVRILRAMARGLISDNGR